MDECESPPIFLSHEDDVDVYWEEPIFSDNSGREVQVGFTVSCLVFFSAFIALNLPPLLPKMFSHWILLYCSIMFFMFCVLGELYYSFYSRLMYL